VNGDKRARSRDKKLAKNCRWVVWRLHQQMKKNNTRGAERGYLELREATIHGCAFRGDGDSE